MVDIKFFKPVSATSSGTAGGVGTFPAPVAPGSSVSETLSSIGTGYVSLIQSDGSKEQTLAVDDTATIAAPVGAFVSGIFRTTLPTYTDGDGVILHADNRGRLLVSYGEGGITADVEIDQDPAPVTPAGSFVSMKYEATLPTYAGGDAATLHSDSRGRLFITAMDPVSGNTADVGTDDSAGPANPVGTFPMALYRATLSAYTDGDSANLHTDINGRLLSRSSPAATGTTSNVAGSVATTTLLAANTARIGATIFNDSTADLLVKFGATASSTSFTVKLAQDGYLEVPGNYTGIIDGIWASATGSARVTEIT